MAGLNAFEPGQQHAAHAHPGQDKLYVILEGDCVIGIGDEEQTLTAGDAAFAPAGILHSATRSGTTVARILRSSRSRMPCTAVLPRCLNPCESTVSLRLLNRTYQPSGVTSE